MQVFFIYTAATGAIICKSNTAISKTYNATHLIMCLTNVAMALERSLPPRAACSTLRLFFCGQVLQLICKQTNEVFPFHGNIALLFRSLTNVVICFFVCILCHSLAAVACTLFLMSFSFCGLQPK